MDKYIFFCTEKQTKRALELGAPLIKCDTRDKHMIYCGHMCYPRIADYPYAIPTAEEMIGWLEDKHIDCFVFKKIDMKIPYFAVVRENEQLIFSKYYSSRKEATIAAIDAALEYLTNNKK